MQAPPPPPPGWRSVLMLSTSPYKTRQSTLHRCFLKTKNLSDCVVAPSVHTHFGSYFLKAQSISSPVFVLLMKACKWTNRGQERCTFTMNVQQTQLPDNWENVCSEFPRLTSKLVTILLSLPPKCYIQYRHEPLHLAPEVTFHAYETGGRTLFSWAQPRTTEGK